MSLSSYSSSLQPPLCGSYSSDLLTVIGQAWKAIINMHERGPGWTNRDRHGLMRSSNSRLSSVHWALSIRGLRGTSLHSNGGEHRTHTSLEKILLSNRHEALKPCWKKGNKDTSTTLLKDRWPDRGVEQREDVTCIQIALMLDNNAGGSMLSHPGKASKVCMFCTNSIYRCRILIWSRFCCWELSCTQEILTCCVFDFWKSF